MAQGTHWKAFFALLPLTASCNLQPLRGREFLPVSDAEMGPPHSCIRLGKVDGSPTSRRLPRPSAEAGAIDGLKLMTELVGGNYVRVEYMTWNALGSRGWRGSAHGTAYRCALPPPPPEPRMECVREQGLTTCTPSQGTR